MDPEEALKKLREAVQDMKYREDASLATDPAHRARRSKELGLHPILEFVQYFDALDLWLSKGGFLPADWNKNR